MKKIIVYILFIMISSDWIEARKTVIKMATLAPEAPLGMLSLLKWVKDGTKKQKVIFD